MHGAEILSIVLAWMAGVGLGLIFFGGLCWTVRRGLSSRHSALWFSGSLMVRMGIVLAGFYLVSACHYERLLACLTGFVMAQFMVIVFTRSTAVSSDSPVQEASHAPLS